MSSDLATIATTLALYAAVVISPGPNFVMVSRLAAANARSAAYAATFGLAVAAACYAILTMAGLAILLERVGWLSRTVQIAGGLYLIYLGIGAWMTAGGGGAGGVAPEQRSAWSGFRLGILVNLSNPKAIAFFVGLYAVAVPPGTALWAKIVILAGSFAIEVGWYGLVTLVLSTARVRAVYTRFASWIERAAGSLLAAFGLRLIWDRM